MSAMFAHYACPTDDRPANADPYADPCAACPACCTDFCTGDPADCVRACAGPAALLAAAAERLYAATTCPGAWQQAHFPYGTDLLLHHMDDRRWRLALARQDAYITSDDVDRCRAAFGVPAGAGERMLLRYREPRTPGGRALPPLYVVEVTWCTA